MLNEETRAIIEIVGSWQFWTFYAIAFVLISSICASIIHKFMKSLDATEAEEI